MGGGSVRKTMSLTDRLDDASTVGYGHDLLLRKDEKLKGTPIILLTAKTMRKPGFTGQKPNGCVSAAV